MVDGFLPAHACRTANPNVPAAQRCEVGDVLLDSYASCQGMATQYGVRVEIRQGARTARSRWSGTRTSCAVFDNIIHNAIKFSPRLGGDGHREHERRSRSMSPYETTAQHSRGTPAQDLRPVLAGDRRAEARAGHGLGLEIAQGVAELHAARSRCGISPAAGASSRSRCRWRLQARDGATGSSDGSASAKGAPDSQDEPSCRRVGIHSSRSCQLPAARRGMEP